MILKFRYLLFVAVVFMAIGVYVQEARTEPLGDTGTVNTLNPWKVTSSYILPRNATNGLQVNALANCNTIDTDANGIFGCGIDEGGGAASFSTTSADYWDTTKNRWSTTSSNYWETQQTARTADDLSNNTTSDLAEGTNLYWTTARATSAVSALIAATTTTALAEGLNLYWTSARGTTSFNTLFSAGTVGWDTDVSDDWSTTSSNYWETQQTARTADDLSNNSIEDLNDVAAMTENFGDLLYWNGTTWTDIATSSLAYAWSNLVGVPTDWTGTFDGQEGSWYVANSFSTTSANYWETQQTARTADDLSNNTTSDLSEGTNLYWTSARGTTSFNTLFSANTSGWDTSSADDMATATPWTAGQVAYVTNNRTLTSVATGTLTEGVTGLEFTATGNLVGSAAVLNLTSGYSMFLTASGTNWNTFYDTPSNRITDGNGLTWSGNTLNFDGGDTPGGELGGTWASPTLDANALGLEELSDVTDAITENYGDLLGWNGTSWTDFATSSLKINTNDLVEGSNLFYTDLRVGNYINASTTLCVFLTGSAGLCDGDDATGGGGLSGGTAGAIAYWTAADTLSATSTPTANNFIATSTTASSTFPLLSVTTAFNFLGDYITNVLTWFDTKIEALTAVVLQGTWDFGGATSIEIVNGTGPTVDTIGEIALDTTDDQLLVADSGGTARVFGTDEFRVISVTIASTSVAFTSGQTLPAFNHKDALEFTQFKCWVSGGTSKVINLTDGTNDTETITCNTTDTSDTDVATNDTFTAGELGSLEFGATTGTVNYVHFEAYARITRE